MLFDYYDDDAGDDAERSQTTFSTVISEINADAKQLEFCVVFGIRSDKHKLHCEFWINFTNRECSYDFMWKMSSGTYYTSLSLSQMQTIRIKNGFQDFIN